MTPFFQALTPGCEFLFSNYLCDQSRCGLELSSSHIGAKSLSHSAALQLLNLNGVWHEIFDFRLFSWISFRQAPEYPIGAMLNFYENSRRYSKVKVDHRCAPSCLKGRQKVPFLSFPQIFMSFSSSFLENFSLLLIISADILSSSFPFSEPFSLYPLFSVDILSSSSYFIRYFCLLFPHSADILVFF